MQNYLDGMIAVILLGWILRWATQWFNERGSAASKKLSIAPQLDSRKLAPADRESSPQPTSTALQERPRSRLGWRVLLVANEPVIADTLAVILNQYGYFASACYSGNQAVEQARRIRPRVVISDVIMKDLNGIDGAIQILQEQPTCHILLFSARATTDDLLENARAQGYDFDIMPAPFHPAVLLHKLAELENKPDQIPAPLAALNPTRPTEFSKAVLCMDDHEVLARISCEIIEMVGYRAVPIYEANKVLDALADRHFDLVVTDQNHGTPSGVELARLIHERHPGLPIILVSGNLPDIIPEDIAESIPKELMFPRLLEVIYREIGPPFPITRA